MPVCPHCQSQYPEGTAKCSDCGTQLLSDWEFEEESETPHDLVEVTKAQGELEAQLIHSLLESYGIESILKGEAIRYIHGFNLTNLGTVRVLVRAEDEPAARLIIEDADGQIRCTECGEEFDGESEICPRCGTRQSEG